MDVAPHSHFSYWIPNDLITWKDVNNMVKHVKQELETQILRDTKSDSLNEEETAAIKKINNRNLASFLLREKATQLFNICNNYWMGVLIVSNDSNRDRIAIQVCVDYKVWLGTDWSKAVLPEFVPLIVPKSRKISNFIRKISNCKRSGWLLPKINQPRIFHVVNKRKYKSAHTAEQWAVLQKNDGWYTCTLTPIEEGKKEAFKFFSWFEDVVKYNLVICDNSRLYVCIGFFFLT